MLIRLQNIHYYGKTLKGTHIEEFPLWEYLFPGKFKSCSHSWWMMASNDTKGANCSSLLLKANYRLPEKA